jgi:ABC-type dipeptide/oligopeptide/nickel transport system permease subunit
MPAPSAPDSAIATSVLLAIALSGALGAGIGNALLSLTLVFVPQVARIAPGRG